MILVLFASSPSADEKTMVISGPCSRIFVTAIHTPATAATMGMTQTSESRVRFLGTALASGTLENFSVSGMLHLAFDFLCRGGIPDQPRVERFDRQHGQDHDRCKEQ